MGKESAFPRGQSTDPAERELLVEARGGDLFACEEIVKRHQRSVHAVARSCVFR